MLIIVSRCVCAVWLSLLPVTVGFKAARRAGEVALERQQRLEAQQNDELQAQSTCSVEGGGDDSQSSLGWCHNRLEDSQIRQPESVSAQNPVEASVRLQEKAVDETATSIDHSTHHKNRRGKVRRSPLLTPDTLFLIVELAVVALVLFMVLRDHSVKFFLEELISLIYTFGKVLGPTLT